MYYNKDCIASQNGPAANFQMLWLQSEFSKSPDTHFILQSHIYAGARFKHEAKTKESDLWFSTNNDHYFDLFEANQKQIVIEIAGHDHWEDVRVFNRDTKGAMRNIFIAAAVSPDHGQLPGFNTFKVDLDTFVPFDVVQTNSDITSVYGKSSIPSDVPYNQLVFSDFGFKDFTIAGIKEALFALFNGPFSRVEEYLTSKLGFPVVND